MWQQHSHYKLPRKKELCSERQGAEDLAHGHMVGVGSIKARVPFISAAGTGALNQQDSIEGSWFPQVLRSVYNLIEPSAPPNKAQQ